VFEPGEVWVYNASGIAIEGQYVNFANVTASYDDEEVYDEDLSHYFGVTEPVFEALPSIDLEKHTNGHDNDTAPGLDILAGSAVEWTYHVNNTGNVNLTNLVLFDNRTTSISSEPVIGDDGDGVFEPGEVWVYNASGIAIEGQYVNFANVTASYDDEEVYDEDLSHYFGVNASIDIEKFTDGHDADEPIGPFLLLGYPVEWTYEVKNTGNVDLVIDVQDNDVNVTPLYVDGDDGDDVFEPGEVWVYNASGTVILGQYSNVGNVTGYNGTFIATDADSSHYFGINNPTFKDMAGGKGYWKNPDNWPEEVTEITIGNVTYLKDEAINYQNPVEGKPDILFGQLVPAKLNVMVGLPYYPYVIDGELVYFIEAADAWLEEYPLGSTGPEVDAAWAESGEELKDVLEMYNNGVLYSNG
ncbi:DUF7507 domain-containing protein, partial [Methanococcoides cohabitans]